MRSQDWKNDEKKDRPLHVRCANNHIVATLPAGYSPQLRERTRKWRCPKCWIPVAIPIGAENVKA